MSIHPWPIWRAIGKAISTPICKMFSWLLNRCMTRTLKSSTAEFEMCSRCDKNQLRLETYMSPHVRSVFYRGEREFQPLLPGIVKFKYLMLNYKKIITFLIGTISATIYILKVSVNTRADIYTAVKDNAPNLPNTVKIESNLRSSVKNAVVPHLVLDTLYSNVNEKLASIEFKYALVEPIIIGSMGLTFLSAQGTSANASASIYFASNAMQYFIDVRKADKSTSNIILLYLQLFNGYRSQIPSVSVKVKKFR
ncbi:uncharacterized protein LOC129250042 [Anastrepha obliqua]|uniref:uncharacterized protein LOC129250042 n=1 Tax=Anastrepha obliqua TaxID=95512 RepID=UPI00240A847E|nr:uncharacterized protein LOC129250042 [Anastrepha obliqua]